LAFKTCTHTHTLTISVLAFVTQPFFLFLPLVISGNPGIGTGLLWSNVTSIWSRNIFWTGCGPCKALPQDMWHRMHHNITCSKRQTPCTGLVRRVGTTVKRWQPLFFLTVCMLRGRQMTV